MEKCSTCSVARLSVAKLEWKRKIHILRCGLLIHVWSSVLSLPPSCCCTVQCFFASTSARSPAHIWCLTSSTSELQFIFSCEFFFRNQSVDGAFIFSHFIFANEKFQSTKIFSAILRRRANWIAARRSTFRSICGLTGVGFFLIYFVSKSFSPDFTAQPQSSQVLYPAVAHPISLCHIARLSSAPTVKSGCLNFLHSSRCGKSHQLASTCDSQPTKNFAIFRLFIIFRRSAIHLEKSKSFRYRLHVFKYWFLSCERGRWGRNQKCGWCVQREILIHKLLHRSRDYPKKSLFRHVRWIWRRELFFIAFQLFLLLRWLSFSYERLQGNLLSRLKSPSGFFLFQFSCENISAKILSRSPSLDFLKIDLSGIRDPF